MRDDDGHSYFRVPRMVRGLADTDVASVCCGSNFTLAVDRNGVTYRWGGSRVTRGERHAEVFPTPGRLRLGGERGLDPWDDCLV